LVFSFELENQNRSFDFRLYRTSYDPAFNQKTKNCWHCERSQILTHVIPVKTGIQEFQQFL